GPYAMIGHSIGEYVAACLSGVFSLEEALELVAVRGQLMHRAPGGAMLGVSIPVEQLTLLLSSQKNLCLAAVNGPRHVVVSGPTNAIEQFQELLNAAGHKNRRLHTSHAFHSKMMEPVLEKFREKVSRVTLNKPEIPYVSNVTGLWITVEESTDPGYWTSHLRRTVQFDGGVKTLLEMENPVFIEVGPGNVLSSFVRRQAIDHQHQEIPLIKHPKEKKPGYRYFLGQLGELWLVGISLDWRAFYQGEKRYRAALPT
ncbi:MAG: acyltransferase domain-containing protein, partial [bacterium]|nr:acyltransferase domain-containing protein [bacterium]